MSAKRKKQLEVVGDDKERLVPLVQIAERAKQNPLLGPREVDAWLVEREHACVGSGSRGDGNEFSAGKREIVWMDLRLTFQLKQAERLSGQLPGMLPSQASRRKLHFTENS